MHVARTVCRRAERTVCALHETGSNVSPLLIQYLNRLSDLLFTMARMETTDAA
ncbi:MAG: ATP:cob(I)alamin adenosyltransferase [Planctomycetaceae bacterium]|nr:ATP:cob(I)alamin adenosyltransferase [Planctomycetaceae bacterium]